MHPKGSSGEVPVGVRALNSYGNSGKIQKEKDSVDFERILQKKERMWWLRKIRDICNDRKIRRNTLEDNRNNGYEKSAACADGRRTRRER